MCNLRLIFQIKKFDLSDLELYTNDQQLEYASTIKDNLIVVDARIHLPTNLQIISRGKNLTLKEFWLGNVRASDTMLNKICSVTYANGRSGRPMPSTSLLIPGTMRVEIYSRSFIEYHLINKNLCVYYE